MKQITIGYRTAAYYANYLAHVPCYQDGTESVNTALDISGKGNHLQFGASLTEGNAWAVPGQLATAYATSSDQAVKLPAAAFNVVDFEAGDHFIVAMECQITNPAATQKFIVQGQGATKCGIRMSIRTSGAVTPSIWTPSGQHTTADSAFNLGEASPSAWSQYLMYIGGKGLDGAGTVRMTSARNGAMDAVVFRSFTGVGEMSTLRTEDLYLGGNFEFSAGYALTAKWRNFHLIRVPASADMGYTRIARLASRLARSPNLPVTAQELGL